MTATPTVDIAEHTGLIPWTIRRYRLAAWARGALEKSDLYSAGLRGLMRASQTWDPQRGKFSTYAAPWIRQAIQREIQNYGCVVRRPSYLQDRLRQAGQCRMPRVLSLSAPLKGAADSTLADVLPDEGSIMPDADLERESAERELAGLIERARLSDRERRVLALRAADVGLAEIGDDIGMSRERARQIEREALGKLRQAAGCAHVRGSIADALGASRRRTAA